MKRFTTLTLSSLLLLATASTVPAREACHVCDEVFAACEEQAEFFQTECSNAVRRATDDCLVECQEGPIANITPCRDACFQSLADGDTDCDDDFNIDMSRCEDDQDDCSRDCVDCPSEGNP